MNYQTFEENTKYFNVYKLLPIIFAFGTLGLFFVWGILDSSIFKIPKFDIETSFWGTSIVDYTYGLMQFETAFECLIVWIIIGSIPSLIVYFVVKIKISPVILQTEYLALIANSICNDVEEDGATKQNPWDFSK